MTSIERNFNGVLYRVSVKEEERRMRMVEGEEQVILQEPRVTEVSLEKVVSLEVTVGPNRGVLLQRWHQEGGEGGGAQVVKNKFDNDDLKR